MSATNSFGKIVSLVLTMGVLVVGTGVYADIGEGWLAVEGAPYDYLADFFGLQIDVAYIVEIVDVSPTEIGGTPIPETIPVWVKSWVFGNTM